MKKSTSLVEWRGGLAEMYRDYAEENLPSVTPVLIYYLQHYAPASLEDCEPEECFTSQMVADRLAGMGKISPDDITYVMHVAGYTADFIDGEMKWLVRKVDVAPGTGLIPSSPSLFDE